MQFYTSYAVGNREPVRDDFVQSTPNSRPQPEQLHNGELGLRMQHEKWSLITNAFGMYYKNQLILTGEINDVGAYVRIIAFNEYIDNYDNYDAEGNMIQTVIAHKNTDIAFSPNVISALGLHFNPREYIQFALNGKYVGKQFLDNTSSDSRMIEDYFTLSFQSNFVFSAFGLNEIQLGLQVNNLLNTLYSNNGYTWGYIYGGQRIVENFLFPQAGVHLLGRISVRF
jgi:iron complex outermembrane receptor protein